MTCYGSRRRGRQTLLLMAVMVAPLVLPAGARAERFGDVVGSFGGVIARSNYLPPSPRVYNIVKDAVGRDVNVGMKWECVEYVRRYYLQTYGMDLRSRHEGDAWTFASPTNARKMGLVFYPNGGKVPPRAGDILVSDYRLKKAVGHVAIVTGVDAAAGRINVIQQNRFGTSKPVGSNGAFSSLGYSDRTHLAGGTAFVGPFFTDQTYSIAGWLRRDAAEIVSPAQGSQVYYPVTLSWRGGTGTYTNAEEYRLWLGSWPAGGNLYIGSAGLQTDVTPYQMGYVTPGQTVYVTLWTKVAGAWQANQYSYTMGSKDGPTLNIDYSTFSYGRQGRTFAFIGNGFTPWTPVTRIVRNEMTGQEFVLGPWKADSAGRVAWTFASDCWTQPGTYTVWVDASVLGWTGWAKKSTNRVVEHVLSGCVGW
jgi:hypothetical protein